jgi:CCR4-NOT transcription complex subunit 4
LNESSSYPPLFDDNGGIKRKAMREQQEESRLLLDQESLADLRSVADPSEEEQPESGSLQLGGEPEDRDLGRSADVSSNFQRGPNSQLPIQRGSSAASLGSHIGQNFPQNLGHLTSINGRPLTALQQQQLQLMKTGGQPSPSSFADQYPPGIGNQINQNASLFQQQGHNRQSSRFGFNDGSATSIKTSGNPKLMAQQASMMPGSHSQTAGQFFGSSMPGPPPGLKSSGTPPIGGMFGQAQSFGGASFGGLSKESQNEMLRDILRSRGSGGGSQGHDASKREYMFPSFLNQYPSTSSTPAPASGLLASLYGPQTGAFHDFGQKQKKKGKKHRHANTSSSGGGGLVDVADPSILHARMQHQQQSNAGVGQGFGGQGQGGYNPSMMYGTGYPRW